MDESYYLGCNIIIVTAPTYEKNSRRRIVVGSTLFVLLAALVKSCYLSLAVSDSINKTFLHLISAEAAVIGLVLLVGLIPGIVGGRFALSFSSLLSLLICTLYLLDCFVVVALDNRIHLRDFSRFAPEIPTIMSFIDPIHVFAFVICISSFALRTTVGKRSTIDLALVGTFFLSIGIVEIHIGPSPLEKYHPSLFSLFRELTASEPSLSTYSDSEINYFRATSPAAQKPKLVELNRDIILVIVESFSAKDSLKTSGLNNYFPRFDALARQGMLFTNCLANAEASEGSHIALLSGFAPIHFPTSGRNLYAEFGRMEGIVSSYSKSGYNTELLTTGDLDFLDGESYFLSPYVGFKLARGKMEVPAFIKAPKFSLDCPSDRVLFDEALLRVKELSKSKAPFLLTLITIGSHFPYSDPLGRRGTKENMWSYLDEQLVYLTNELEKQGFLNQGILILTGDHRIMSPVKEHEQGLYGDSAKARVPLLILGAGVPKDVIDHRFVQHKDILRKLPEIINGESPISPNPIWTERYSILQGSATVADRLQFFEEKTKGVVGYDLILAGRNISWAKDRPQNATKLQQTVHRQRALHQHQRSKRLHSYLLKYSPPTAPSDKHGLRVLFFDGTIIEGDLSEESKRFLGETTIDTLNFEDFKNTVSKKQFNFSTKLEGYLRIEKEGQYWFKATNNTRACLSINSQIVLGCSNHSEWGNHEGMIFLKSGLHAFELRMSRGRWKRPLMFSWLPPGEEKWQNIDAFNFFLPKPSDSQEE